MQYNKSRPRNLTEVSGPVIIYRLLQFESDSFINAARSMP